MNKVDLVDDEELLEHVMQQRGNPDWPYIDTSNILSYRLAREGRDGKQGHPGFGAGQMETVFAPNNGKTPTLLIIAEDVEGESGLPTGKRQHKPVTGTKPAGPCPNPGDFAPGC